MSKYEFDKKILVCLRHIVDDVQLGIDHNKMKAIVDCPRIANVTKTRSFLGDT